MSSAQALVRIGDPIDLFYADHDTQKKQVIPTLTDQRYTQEFSNKSTGTSVLTISPNSGVSHCIAVLGWNASTLRDLSGSALALNRGWGYEAIEQISFRIGKNFCQCVA